MRFLAMALFAEGPTDHRFLGPILRRVSADLCLQHGVSLVEIGEVLELHSPQSVRNRDRETRIVEAVKQARGEFHLLFIHTDGAGDPSQARQQRVDPALQRIRTEFPGDSPYSVAVVPVRETEAWALVDGDALHGAFGTRLGDSELGVPSAPTAVERIADPKHQLRQALDQVV